MVNSFLKNSNKIGELNIMEILTSTSGTRYIELAENKGRIIFSRMTATKTGYKYLCFNNRYIDFVTISKGKGNNKVKSQIEVQQFDSFTFDMDFKRDEKGMLGVPHGTIPRRIVDNLRFIFKPFLVDMIMPFNKFVELEIVLADTSYEKLMATPIKRKAYKRKKKKSKSKGKGKKKIKETTII